MSKKFCYALCITSLFALSIKSFADNADSAVGINLTGMSYWSTQWVTIDLMKQASNGSGKLWATTNAHTYQFNTGHETQLDLDQQGWPRSLPTGSDASFHYATTIILHDNAHYAAGDYVVLYEGEGAMSYIGPELITSSPGRDVVRLGENNFFHLQIQQTDPNQTGEYLRNIRIISPGGSCSSASTDFASDASECAEPNQFTSFEFSYANRVFHPLFLKDLAPFRTLRFMQFLNTIDNPIVDWTARTQHHYASWALSGGSPIETALDLSNATQAEAWINIPVRVNDAYISNLAELIKQRLDSHLDVYLEFGNEIWNNAWPYINDALYLEEQGRMQWTSNEISNIELRMNYYGMRATQMCDIAKSVFAERASQVKCVMGGQTGVPWISEQALDCPLYANNTVTNCAANMDVLAVGSYFAGYLADERYLSILTSWTEQGSNGLSALFDEMYQGLLFSQTYNPSEPDWWQAPENGALEQARSFAVQGVALAEKYNLMLAAYEGGQHLTYAGNRANGRQQISEALFLPANRDPRMAEVFYQHLNDWRSAGASLFIAFESIGKWDDWGAFPLKEYQTQTVDEAVKYAAVVRFIEETPCWWTDCNRDIVPPSIEPTPPEEPDPSDNQAKMVLLSANLFETNGVRLDWSVEDFDVTHPLEFIIYRNNQPLITTQAQYFEDHWLPLGVEFDYRVEAISVTTGYQVATEETVSYAGDSIVPSSPSNLTLSSDQAYGVYLNWQASEDNQGIQLYKIYRNGVPYTLSFDNTFHDVWPPAGRVTYQIIAQDMSGNVSLASNEATTLVSYE